MGSISKLVSGIILFIIGIFISYESYIYGLKDIILVVGLIIALIGIIIIISYLVDSSANKTNAMFKEYLKGIEKRSNFSNNSKEESNQMPLKIRREFDNYDNDFYSDDLDSQEYSADDFNSVFEVSEVIDETSEFGNSLNFTPNYDKPLKITRAPKRRERSIFSDDIYGNEGNIDKSESIKRALSEETPVNAVDLRPKNEQVRDIKIDVNNPDSLPIPKLLNSYIISNDEIINSKDAFEQLGTNIKKEVMLEIPSLNDLSDRFLSHIPSIYSRVIIEDFDVSNISYMILVASLLKQGVHIKTMPKVNTINLITDDSQAMILSKGRRDGDVEYGAIYEDRNALSDIRSSFEKTWEMAKDLDENILLRYMGQEVA
ncbi:MAG: hypothetical protein Q4P18_04685 [Methanobrevibacter sp.]|uniref:hypothetical protein n=1 Tax=Methanobrevibacter sp. TaxID=66852 RepID=UPI0026DFC015|nr:hypothetical protein [Methanobrevibacter sp.]MDO5848809.1 hypothetical protein [Methanobrevibacter sp.]